MREYPFERISSAGIYILTILLFYIFISKAKDKKQISTRLNIYTIVLTILAFLYIPSRGSDISRLVFMGDAWANMGTKDFIDYVLTSSTPFAVLYIYLIQKLQISGALSAVSAFIYYKLIFSCVKIINDNHEVKSKSISTAVFFFMCSSSFLGVVSSVRFPLAMATIIRCIIYEWYYHKGYIRHLIVMIMACLIHTAAVPVVILWGLTILAQKNSKMGAKVFIIFVTVCVAIFFGSYLELASDKFSSYSENTYFDIKLYALSFINFFILLFFYLPIKKNELIRTSIVSSNFTMIKLFTFFEIIICRYFAMFARFLGFYQLLFFPATIFYAECGEENKVYHNNILILAFIRLICSYLGDMTAIKFFVLK